MGTIFRICGALLGLGAGIAALLGRNKEDVIIMLLFAILFYLAAIEDK